MISIDQYVIPDTKAEFLLIKLPYYHLNILLIYRHPDINIEKFCKSLINITCCKELNRIKETNIILGDINIDILKTSNNSKKYVDLVKSLNYNIVNNLPTRITDNSETCIDHVLLNKSSVLNINCKTTSLEITDHESIIVDVYCDAPKSVNNKLRTHNLRSVTAFDNVLRNVNWNDFFDVVDNVDACVDQFLNFVTSLYEKCFPLKKAKNKKSYFSYSNHIQYLVKKELSFTQVP